MNGQNVPVHLVGSVPLGPAANVFAALSETLGDRAPRIPDGEPGERLRWVGWTFDHTFASNSSLEVVPDPAGLPLVQVKPGHEANLAFGNIGFEDAARASYQDFRRLRDEGVVGADTRLQVAIPTVPNFMCLSVVEDARAAVEPAFERALVAEVARIAHAIPHEDLAMQFDVNAEIAFLEGAHKIYEPYFADVPEGAVERIARLVSVVPVDVQLGFHFCYGDRNHEHWAQPQDTGIVVGLINAIVDRVARPIDWVHIPVPRDRDDHAYFAPLGRLTTPDSTDLFLGLVHYTDGLDGTLRRADAAREVRPRFGIATECGFGRRPPETILDLLKLHVAAADHLSKERA
jgi:hypothetical protein